MSQPQPAWQPTVERWLRRANRSHPPAILLGASTTGLSFARSLGRRGVPLLVLDRRPLVALYTRFAYGQLLPPVYRQPQDWLELLEFAGRRLPAPAVLIAAADEYALFVAAHAAQLRRHFLFLNSEIETVERLVDKRLQYGVAEAAGVPLPRTYFPDSIAEARRLGDLIQYPCLLKPYVSHLGRRRLPEEKVRLVHSPADMLAAFERLHAADTPFLLQEYIPGDDSAVFGYMALWDEAGRELAWLTMRKLRQHPPLCGDASLVVTVHAPEVAELGRRLLRAFDYRGHAGIEFKLDRRDGSYRLIEINPRSEGFAELAVGAGVDFPWMGYRHLTGADAEPPPAFRPGVKYVNEDLDLLSYLAYRSRDGLTAMQWLGSLRGARPMVWAWDDPLPLLKGLWRMPGHFWRRRRRAADGATLTH
jgi:D-aspartate ligase